MSISVVFVVKNALNQGYCFWESLHSAAPFADEIILSEGYSDDDTLHYLQAFKRKFQKRIKIDLFQERWPDTSYHGEVIAEVSQRAIEKATCDWVYYLQADEIIHELNVDHIKHVSTLPDFNSVSFPFYHFIRSWEPSEEGYREAMRMVRNHRNIKLMGDAWNFEGEVDPICPAGHSPKPIYHFAWVFPKQNDIKDIEHSKIYQNMEEYQLKMRKAVESINEEKKPYPRTEFNDFPKLAKRFLWKAEYEPPTLK